MQFNGVQLRDYQRTSSVSAKLQKMNWNTLQQWRARSRVVTLYRIRHNLIAIPAAVYLQPVPTCTIWNQVHADPAQPNTYSQSFSPHTISMWFQLILLLLHCSTSRARNCSLLAVRYCSVLSWHLFWKTKTKEVRVRPRAYIFSV